MGHDPTVDVGAAIAEADASYTSIRNFVDWVPEKIDVAAWDEAAESLSAWRGEADPVVVDAALAERLRAAAVDTGAIEGLYTTDRGFTLSVAQQSISLDQAEVEKGADFRRNFEAQLEGFELALDVATAATPMSEALIRRLHEVTCAGQGSYRVLTPLGVQERRLALGAYKTDPNHVQLGDGTFHAYAPVGQVADEMHCLVEQVGSAEFQATHPVVQAAYAHHALTVIHPFADGNGRVARLLASIWLLRAASIPLWVEPGDRDRYLDALVAADRGDETDLIDLVAEVSLRLLRELQLAISTRRPSTRAEPSETQREVDVMKRALQRATSDVGRSLSMNPYSGPSSETPSSETELVFASEHPSEALGKDFFDDDGRYLTCAADPAAPESRRFWVLGWQNDAPVDLREAFATSEVVPSVSPSAVRRMELVARHSFGLLGQPADSDLGPPSLSTGGWSHRVRRGLWSRFRGRR